MIARNAEKTIARSLQSVVQIAHEVVVVVNDCTDDTVHIAESYGAIVIEHPWEGFRDQKNFAIGQVNCEWVLSLDADEVVSDILKQSILGFIGARLQGYSAAQFSRKTFFLGKWIAYGDWYPDYNTRLFRKGQGQFIGNSVHETLDVSGKTKRIVGDLLHYTYVTLAEFVQRNIKYADLAAMDMHKNGKRVFIPFATMKSHWRFFRCYILRFGFLDGYAGYFIAKLQSFLAMYKYIRLHHLNREAVEESFFMPQL
jgi:glycosyltransferase involved in cell wall biosynthesis